MSKVLVVCDSFKDTLSSSQIGKTLQQKKGYDYLAIADGGENSINSLAENKVGTLKIIDNIEVLVTNDTVMIETAKVVPFLSNNKDVLNQNSAKLGRLLQTISKSYKKAVIFVGGTSTNDGGFGLLEALGYEFLDKSLNVVKPTPNNLYLIKSVKKCTLPDIDITIATDVKNTLCGQEGATAIYGPQKGIINVESLDQEIFRVAKLISTSNINVSGTGSGGGITFGLLEFKKSRIISGIEFFINILDLESLIQNYDIILTGEGRLDLQSLNGKLPIQIAKLAKKYSKLVYIITGINQLEHYPSNLIDGVFEVTPRDLDYEIVKVKALSILESFVDSKLKLPD